MLDLQCPIFLSARLQCPGVWAVKQWGHVLRSTGNSPQTSLKALWIFAVQRFDLNVWPLIWNSLSTRHTCRLFLNNYRVHYRYNQDTCFFLKPATNTIFTSIASSNLQYCQPVHCFWNDPRINHIILCTIYCHTECQAQFGFFPFHYMSRFYLSFFL